MSGQLSPHQLAETGQRRRALAGRLGIEEHGQGIEVAAEVEQPGAGRGIVLAQLHGPAVAGHQHHHRQRVAQRRAHFPGGPRAPAVAAALGIRHLAAAPADDRQQEIGIGHPAGELLDAGAVFRRRNLRQRLETQLARHLAGRGPVRLEIFGRPRDRDPQHCGA